MKLKKQLITLLFMTRFLFLLIFLIPPAAGTYGQTIRQQAGLRTGYMGGIFYQASAPSGIGESGLYAMISFRENGLQLTGLRTYTGSSLTEISRDLVFGWGYGGHAGFIVTRDIRFLGRDYYFGNDRFCPLAGIDGYGFLEYRFSSIPLALGLNIKPYIELTMPSFIRLFPGDIGISVSYVF